MQPDRSAWLASPPLFAADAPSAAALAALRSHPKFAQASRAVATGLVRLYRGDRLVHAVVTDRVRYIISVLAVDLHFAARPDDPRSGLTASRIRALCAELGLCSPGRAHAMLMLMRLYGYLAPAPNEADRRLRRLAATDRLLDWHRRRCAFIFDALACMLPEGAQAAAKLESAAFMASFMRCLAHTYVAGFYYVDHVPDVRLFYERNAGVAILMTLLLSGEADDAFPPARPVSCSLSALSRSFGVSRVHVRRLLNDCVSAGLLERTGETNESFRVLPRLADAVHGVLAIYMLHHAHCARAALAEGG